MSGRDTSGLIFGELKQLELASTYWRLPRTRLWSFAPTFLGPPVLGLEILGEHHIQSVLTDLGSFPFNHLTSRATPQTGTGSSYALTLLFRGPWKGDRFTPETNTPNRQDRMRDHII